MNLLYICSNILAAHVYRKISPSCSDIQLVVPIRILTLLEELVVISFPISNGL